MFTINTRTLILIQSGSWDFLELSGAERLLTKKLASIGNTIAQNQVAHQDLRSFSRIIFCFKTNLFGVNMLFSETF